MIQLESYLAQFKAETVAVAFHDLQTGKEFFHLTDASMHPASTFKVAVMMGVFHQAEQGLFSLSFAE